jgi:hypothetical protein
MISTRSEGLVIDTVVCLTLAKWEIVSAFPFKQSGDFMKAWPAKADQNHSARREPRHTRIGAVPCLNHYNDGPEVKHRAFMTHNPNAAVPLPRDLWHGIPEFSCQSGKWCWSDISEQERELGFFGHHLVQGNREGMAR